MQRYSLPGVEVLTGGRDVHPAPGGRRAFRRAFVFVLALAIGAGAGLAWNFSRAPVYRAVATVQTVKPKSIDQPSAAADREHVAIQERTLLGEELLARVTADVAASGFGAGASPESLAGMLSIAAVPDTNLVELRAEGPDPGDVQTVVNAWAAAYETLRREQIAQMRRDTLDEIQEEYETLQAAIAAQADDLAQFREDNDIVSRRDADNRPVSVLRGLNASLNKARERLVEAEARRDTVREAIAAGKTVVPRDQRSALSARQTQVNRLWNRLETLRGKFTERYIETDPKYRDLPAQLEEAKQELAAFRQAGQAQMLEEVDQDVAAARAALAKVEEQLEGHERNAAEFASIFSRHEALENELKELRKLATSKAERIAAIEARNYEKYPPIDVVEWAELPARPIRPDYWRDAAIVLGAALLGALFLTWLLEYVFGRKEEAAPGMTGVRIIGAGRGVFDTPVLDAERAPVSLDHGSAAAALADASLPFLDVPDAARLLAAAEPVTGAYVALLLSGVSPEELEALDDAVLDAGTGRLALATPRQRELLLPAAVTARLPAIQRDGEGLRGIAGDELDEAVTAAALDAALDAAGDIDAATVRAAYLVHLVRQGARLSELRHRAGRLGNDWLVRLARFSPPGPNRPLDQIELRYPLFADADAAPPSA